MKRITLICLLLLTLSFGAMGGTSTIRKSKTMTVGSNITVSPCIDGNVFPTSQSWTLSDNSAFTIVPISGGSGTDTWGNIWWRVDYKLTAIKTGTYTFTVKMYNPGWVQSPGNEHTTYVIYTITVNSSGGGGGGGGNTNVQVTSISFSESNYYLCLGDQMQLTPIIIPSNASNQSLSWSSSNTNVATVNSSGAVSALEVGTTTVTATTNDGSNLSATCNITVLPAQATGIELDQTSVRLEQGRAIKLYATVSPTTISQEVAWTSSNTSVATVNNNGIVMALELGNATITATTKDGSNLSASCEVTVVPESAWEINLNETAVNLHFGEASQLVATVTPVEAIQDVSWTSSDKGVATVDENGLILARGLGQATITATTIDGSELNATCDVIVSRRNYYILDVNNDGVLTSSDISSLYNYLLSNDITFISTCDVNDDGTVSASDITVLYNQLLGNN